MDRAGIVMIENRLLHIFEILTITRLVAKRPDTYTGVVAIADHHAARAVNDGLRPHRITARYILAAHTMRLHIALIHDIEAVFIT